MVQRSRSHRAHTTRASAIGGRLLARSRVALAVNAALAAAVPAQALADSTPAGADASAPVTLQEVIVTATKRSEDLQKVPQSIDVLTGKDLKNLDIEQFDDYAQKVPSISYISMGPGTQLLVMRGVADGSNPNNPNKSATGVFLDDVSLSLEGVQPDLHLYDLERIEVLNGPQGTTFGAGSMSGAVRYITNKPDVRSFSAGVDVNGGKIQGGSNNQTYEGFLNIPLIDGALGLRMSGFSDVEGGFITNQFTTRTWVNGTVSTNAPWAGTDYNRERTQGGRIALRGVLNEAWSATLTYSYQRQIAFGGWDEDPSLPPRTVVRFGPEYSRNEARILDFHLDGDVGIGDLVFASTYWQLPTRAYSDYSDYEEYYSGGAQEGFTCLNDPIHGTGPYSGCKVPTFYFDYSTNPERWSEEVRLLSKTGGRFHWLLGYYWERTEDHDDSVYVIPGLQPRGAAAQAYFAEYGTTMSSLAPGQLLASPEISDYLQTTEFANINFDITSRLNVEAGIVHFSSNFSYDFPSNQLFWAPASSLYESGESNKVNTKAGVNYKVTDQVLLYADFAQGFRDGGANGLPDSCYAKGVPSEYKPDTLDNFEIGWKSKSLGGRLLWNGAAYLMNWNDLQTKIFDIDLCEPGPFNANVGKARIYGTDSNIDFLINDNWSVQASASYNDSRLVSTIYPVYDDLVGERLPFAPLLSYSWSARYDRPITGHLNGYVQLDMSHKGNMWNSFTAQTNGGYPRFLQPAYSILNLRIGLTPDESRWLTEFYITNLTDKNAIIWSNTNYFDVRYTTNEPRVFGLRLSYRFGEARAE